MNLLQMLEASRAEILADAYAALTRAHLSHYELAGPDVTEERLRVLYDLVEESVRRHNLVPVIEHAERVARERYEAGFDFRQVHAAFNALEEAIWKRAIAEVPPLGLTEAIGLTGTVLGAGKEALAAEYIALASHRKAPSLNLAGLFEGGLHAEMED